MQSHWVYQEAAISIGNYNPFIQTKYSDNLFDRIFEENVDAEDLIWHRDKNDRVVTVLKCGEGWQFQFENELPFELKPDMEIEVNKEEYHRVIKGKGNLKVQIKEIENGSTN